MSEPPSAQWDASGEGAGAIVPMDAAPRALAPVSATDPSGMMMDVDPLAQHGPSPAVAAARLMRAKWLILGVFALLSAATVPWIWLFSKPTYEAMASLRVAPVLPRILSKTEEQTVPYFWMYLESQEATIRGPDVLNRVLDRPEVQATQWYREESGMLRARLGGTPPTPLQRLMRQLEVKPRPNTELIDVSLSTVEPADSAVIVNWVVDEFTKYSEERDRQREKGRSDTLIQDLNAATREIERLTYEQFGISNRDPEELHSSLSQQLNQLQTDHLRLKQQYALTQWQLGNLPAPPSTEGGDGAAAAAESPFLYASDAEWVRRSTALETARNALIEARQRYGEEHPLVKSMVSHVDRAEELLRQWEAQLDAWPDLAPLPRQPDAAGPMAIMDRKMLEWQGAQQKKQLDELEKSMSGLEHEIKQANGLAKESAKRADELQQKIAYRVRVDERIKELEMEGKAPARISVDAYAIPPAAPSRDKRLLLTAMALGGSLMLGLMIGHLRTSPKICEVGDVRCTVRAPFLGQLPALPSGKPMNNGSASAMTEGIRVVRTALLERFGQAGRHVVLITSASSRSGKTSVAVELAHSLAALGKRTLLVEADLRRPALAERLGIHPKVGLAALLCGTTQDRQVIVPSTHPKLDLLLAGEELGEFHPELLANGVFVGCIQRWKQTYDFILLDSPPVLPVADARILAGQADGTVMVLRSSHCRRSDVIHAYADLSAAGGKLLGTVLVGTRAGGAYGYAYGQPHGEGAASVTSAAHRSET